MEFNLIKIAHSFNSKTEQTAQDNVVKTTSAQSSRENFSTRTDSQTSVASTGTGLLTQTTLHSWIRDILVGAGGVALGSVITFILGVH